MICHERGLVLPVSFFTVCLGPVYIFKFEFCSTPCDSELASLVFNMRGNVTIYILYCRDSLAQEFVPGRIFELSEFNLFIEKQTTGNVTQAVNIIFGLFSMHCRSSHISEIRVEAIVGTTVGAHVKARLYCGFCLVAEIAKFIRRCLAQHCGQRLIRSHVNITRCLSMSAISMNRAQNAAWL